MIRKIWDHFCDSNELIAFDHALKSLMFCEVKGRLPVEKIDIRSICFCIYKLLWCNTVCEISACPNSVFDCLVYCEPWDHGEYYFMNIFIIIRSNDIKFSMLRYGFNVDVSIQIFTGRELISDIVYIAVILYLYILEI